MSKPKYSDELLKQLVKESTSFAEVLRKLRPKNFISGGMHAHIKKRIKRIGINTSHFMTNIDALHKYRFTTEKLTADEILVNNRHGYYKEKQWLLKSALSEKGVPYKCSVIDCGISEWHGKPIKLHIEHKNGDPLDNRFENLCFLCPNCHSQTATYAVINKNRNK